MTECIDCDFKIKPSYMYSLDNDLAEEHAALKKLGYDAELTTETDLPFEVKAAIKFPNMAEFHPLKFLYALAKDLTVYENTFIEDIKPHTAFTANNKIKFGQAIVATHFPFIDRAGWFFVKMYQERSYVVALENAGDVNGTYIDDQESGYYWRNYGDLLLLGKGDHRTGTETHAFEELDAFVKKYYPNAKIKYRWANQDCVSLDGMPYIGNYGHLKDVYTLAGFNLWGMTGSMVGAKLLTDLINGKENELAQVFCTQRRILRKQLFENLGVVLVKILTPSTKRCTHLGCTLTYNKREHSWDCSCHGSRFDENGKIINNPASEHLDID